MEQHVCFVELSPGIASRTSITINVDGTSESPKSSCLARCKSIRILPHKWPNLCKVGMFTVTAFSLASSAAVRSNGIIPTRIASHEAQGLHVYKGLGSIMLYEGGANNLFVATRLW